MRLLRIYLN